MRKSPEELVNIAKESAKNAYAPYSKYSVGAVVETDEGQIFTGANMENASYGMTLCAEVGAIQAASSAGKLKNIIRIAVAGGKMGNIIENNDDLTPPCGRCRQLILESSFLSGTDIEVIISSIHSKKIKSYKISELLPEGFGPNKVSFD